MLYWIKLNQLILNSSNKLSIISPTKSFVIFVFNRESERRKDGRYYELSSPIITFCLHKFFSALESTDHNFWLILMYDQSYRFFFFVLFFWLVYTLIHIFVYYYCRIRIEVKGEKKRKPICYNPKVNSMRTGLINLLKCKLWNDKWNG